MATFHSLVPNNSNKTSPETNTPMIVLGNTKSEIVINLKLYLLSLKYWAGICTKHRLSPLLMYGQWSLSNPTPPELALT